MLPLIITKFKLKLKKVIEINKKFNKVIDNATNRCYISSCKRNIKRSEKTLKKRKAVHKPYNELKGALRAKELKYSDVAKLLNISETAVSFKINGKSDFYVSEVDALLKAYNLELDVFLKKKSCDFNNLNMT